MVVRLDVFGLFVVTARRARGNTSFYVIDMLSKSKVSLFDQKASSSGLVGDALLEVEVLLLEVLLALVQFAPVKVEGHAILRVLVDLGPSPEHLAAVVG